jgi:hypothetical protein
VTVSLKRAFVLLPLLAGLCLSACGGDGPSSGGGGGVIVQPPVATNSAPAFTSAATATVAENSTGVFYTATATDADGNAVTYSISGGDDALQFQIDAAGHLSFRSPPDFEAPTDADRNNVYQVQLAASDGIAMSLLTLQVTVTNVTGGTYHVRLLTLGLREPNNLVPSADPNVVWLTEKQGTIGGMRTDTHIVIPRQNGGFLDLRSEVSSAGEGGLLGFAPDPDYVANGFVYVALTTPAGNLELRRYRAFPGTRLVGDPSSAYLILSVPVPDNAFVGGWIGFGPDGYLYVTTGNGPDPGSDPNSLQGKVLRIDIRSDGFPNDPTRNYAIPPDNPFAASGGRPEIWAIGFRQPRSAGFDIYTGNLYLNDWGSPVVSRFESEMNMIRPQDKGGDWTPWRNRLLSSPPLPAGQFYPLFKEGYGLSDPSAFAPEFFDYTAGPVYRGPIESLQGLLIYGERLRNHFGARVASELKQNVTDNTTTPEIDLTAAFQSCVCAGVPPPDKVTAFGEDAAHNLYILAPDGRIFVVEPD